MTYIYDIVLNFNNDFYDFFEWNKDDEIYHIKRIYLMKINTKTYNDFINKKIQIMGDFLLNIFHKCEYFDNREVKEIPYALLVTDSYRVMGIMLDGNGNIIKYSSLLLDEEEDILNISTHLGIVKLNYQIKGDINTDSLTRFERKLIKYIKKDLTISYKDNNLSKLKYLYYEYFSKDCDDINKIYQDLVNELNNINDKHYNLYHLIKLSYLHKSV